MPFNEELRPFFSVQADPTEGYLAVEPAVMTPGIPPNISFEKCRETFSTYFHESTQTILFGVPQYRHRQVSDFLDRTEEILRIGGVPVPPSQCGSTTRYGIMYIQPSVFWKECYIKRSLLTILLRAGIYYEDRSYQQALLKQEFVVPSIPAVMRFLFGFTKYTGQIPQSMASHGWHYLLAGKKDDEVRTLLVKHDDFKPSLVGIGTLWS